MDKQGVPEYFKNVLPPLHSTKLHMIYLKILVKKYQLTYQIFKYEIFFFKYQVTKSNNCRFKNLNNLKKTIVGKKTVKYFFFQKM